jgi:TPP-dependent pyruvate/acetoin dehydrogenase alpha subunit
VWHAAHAAIERARAGGGPGFLHARCVHLEGHFLGFQLKKIADEPLKEMSGMALPLTRSLLGRGGGSLRERTAGLKEVLAAVRSTLRDARRDEDNDPIRHARRGLQVEQGRLKDLEDRIEREVGEALETALREVSP